MSSVANLTTYELHAQSNTRTAHKRNCLLPNPASMHAPRAPRGILAQNRSTRTATFILLGVHRGLITLVGEETTQGQHTDLTCGAQHFNIRPRHRPVLLQGHNEDLNPYFSHCRLDSRYSAGYENSLSPRIPHAECVVFSNLLDLGTALAALVFLLSAYLSTKTNQSAHASWGRTLQYHYASMHPLRRSAGTATKRDATLPLSSATEWLAPSARHSAGTW